MAIDWTVVVLVVLIGYLIFVAIRLLAKLMDAPWTRGYGLLALMTGIKVSKTSDPHNQYGGVEDLEDLKGTTTFTVDDYEEVKPTKKRKKAKKNAKR